MNFIHNDGGRKAAGFKGEAGDCATRAVAIATGKAYLDIYNALNRAAKRERPGAWRSRATSKRSSARTGVYADTLRLYMASLGWEWIPCMSIGSGCRVHLRGGELPLGRIIVRLSGHYAAVIDGVVHDTYNPARNGTRCVYGYWRLP